MMPRSDWYDLRHFLDFLDSRGDLLRFGEEVDPAWEINGLTRLGLMESAPAMLFENIKGAAVPMAVNLLAADRRFLWALGLEKWDQFNEEWCRRTEKPVPPRMLNRAPCQEVVLEGDAIDLHRICNTVWHQYDGGEFPGTLSVSITQDPDTRVLNAGIYRMMTLGPNRLGWGAPEYTHGRQHYMSYERRGEPMPMAVVTGYDPSVFIVASTRTPPGIDEFQIAGGIRGAPLDMIRCQTIDLPVPATSEFVFEGYVRPAHREIEGGFGEYTGYYGEARSNPVFEIHRITHRNAPIYLGSREQWYPSDSALTVGKSSQAVAYKTLKSLVPGILDLRCDVTYEAIVKIDKLFAGHPQQVMDAVWGATYARYKHVIVVDKDVDIWDYNQVHWALSTRVRADRDVYILPRRAGQWLDPAVSLREKGWQTGMGIDATMPNEEYEFWGEKPPRRVDDPEIVARTLAKWQERLPWRATRH
jgi:4-hydroxy-3-polyprenylbenzoate decarboxylase/2,5-furandicarboxylate decarboxylase 1